MSNSQQLASTRKTGREVQRAIARAEAILPGRPAPDGKRVPRWQAIIRIGEFIQSEPEAVWQFTLRWARRAQNDDLRAAVGTCLLKHLLADHFDQFFPRTRIAALSSKRFAKTFQMCWSFEMKGSPNARRMDRLLADIRRKYE